MKLPLHNKSLAVRILLVPLITLLLMACVLTAIAIVGIQNSYETRVSRIIEQTVEESSRYVSAELRNIVTLAHCSLLDRRLQSTLTLDVDGNVADFITAQDAIISVLSQIKVQNQFVESAALMMQGRLFSDGLHQVRYETTPLVDTARTSQLAYWSDAAILNESSGHMVIPIVMRVPTGDFSSRNEAYILINLDAEKLFSYLSSLENSLQCSLILHSKDAVLYDPTGLYPSLGSDSSYIINDSLLEINNWSLCCAMERDTLYASRNAAMRRTLAASILIAAIGLALSYWVARSILDPIQSLTQAAQRVGGGDYTVQTGVTGQDELGTLGRAFNTMTDQIGRNIQALEEKNRQIAESESRKRRAEMQVLQAQINPHFLYNTLDSLYWYALSGRQKDIGLIVEKLSDMLRIGLSKGSEYIPIEQELRHVQDYLDIQKVIFCDKFDYTVETNGLCGQKVLKILLQPLVENSINHGFANMERDAKICIRVLAEPDALALSVTDNGCGFDFAEKNEKRSPYAGFALQNIEQRLQAHYGERAALTIQSEAYCETTVTIRIAWPEGESL